MIVVCKYIYNHNYQGEIKIETKNNYLDSNKVFDLIKAKTEYVHCYILKILRKTNEKM